MTSFGGHDGRYRGSSPATDEEVVTMPMNVPAVADERQGLLAFLAQQRAAVRTAAHGLTEDQARLTTTASTLSIGGLVKHVAEAEKGWTDRVLGGEEADPGDYQAYLASFHLAPDETLAGVLDLYETTAARTDTAMADAGDLGRAVPLPTGVPWFPEGATVRWVLLHLVEETARHAGHADIIRESLDGAQAGSLMAAAENWEPSPWVTPWTPAGAPAS
jgi:uncharacterized damage-inducible protein DinB